MQNFTFRASSRKSSQPPDRAYLACGVFILCIWTFSDAVSCINSCRCAWGWYWLISYHECQLFLAAYNRHNRLEIGLRPMAKKFVFSEGDQDRGGVCQAKQALVIWDRVGTSPGASEGVS